MNGLRHITNKSWIWHVRLQTYSTSTLGKSNVPRICIGKGSEWGTCWGHCGLQQRHSCSWGVDRPSAFHSTFRVNGLCPGIVSFLFPLQPEWMQKVSLAVWERQSLVAARPMLVAVGLETGETQLCWSREWGVVLFLAFSVKLGGVWIACFSFGAVVGFEAGKVYWGRCFCGIWAFAISLLSGCVPSHFSGAQLSKQTVLQGRNTSLLSVCGVGSISVAVQFTTTAHVLEVLYSQKHFPMVLFVCFFVFWPTVSLCSCGISFVDQAGIPLQDPPISAIQVLGLKVWGTMLGPYWI